MHYIIPRKNSNIITKSSDWQSEANIVIDIHTTPPPEIIATYTNTSISYTTQV